MTIHSDTNMFLRSLFEEAVAVADPMRVIARHLPDRTAFDRVLVLGAGKASARMAEALEAAWGPCEGVVLTRYAYGRPTEGIEIVEASHPVPDAAGMDAAEQLLDLARGAGPDDLVILLISGGGSALLCAPGPGMNLEEKRAVHQALLSSGAPIGQMNVVRKHLSGIKGGRLAAAIHPARSLCLMISDVPGDDPADIASGPTVGETSTPADARAIVEAFGMDLPASAMALLRAPSGVIAPDDARLSKMENRIVSAPSQSLEAAARIARSAGCEVRNLGDALEGEARDLGVAQAEMALDIQSAMQPGNAPVLLLSGGECTVSGRGSGVGGPNAEYALAAAIRLQGQAGIHLIACDTDGVDGAAEVAGALVGPDTLVRAAQKGVSPERAMETHDSHSFHAAIGGQIVTGPTLTNVNDFRAILIQPV